METYISYNGMLLLRHEWAGGGCPSDKVLKDRQKLAQKYPDEVRIITDERGFDTGPTRTIYRKGS